MSRAAQIPQLHITFTLVHHTVYVQGEVGKGLNAF